MSVDSCPDNITTLAEAAQAFENVAARAQRCSLQVATWKAHEQQIRRFLLERALPAADVAAKDRAGTASRRDEDYSSALLRMKGVPLSPQRSALRAAGGAGQTARADDDAVLAGQIQQLKGYYAGYSSPKRN